MCIYTVKKQKFFKSSRGVRDTTKRPKLAVSGAEDTAKTNEDLGMLCYIQVEYSVFSAGSSLLNMEILFSKIF